MSQPSRYPLEILAMAYSSVETLTEQSGDLAELNSSTRELEVIKSLSRSRKDKYFLGYDCTKANFMKNAPRASLIHLSTHGGYNPQDRSSGKLYLRQGKALDSLVQDELRYRKIQPKLVVLSACDSGAGMASNEEGMFSIGRAFQAFGAEQAVTALWPLSANASADIFKSFYTHLFSGESPQAALRKAQLEMINRSVRYQLPAFWASLVLHR